MSSNGEVPARPVPELNALECKGCGRCVAACPKDVLVLGTQLNERGHHYVTYRGEGCVGCANCYYVCPEPYAIRVHRPADRKARE